MPQDMLEAYAVGGPRDRVKLTAPIRWDGKIYRNSVSYPGHYVFTLIGKSESPIWKWIETGDIIRRPRSKRSDLELEL